MERQQKTTAWEEVMFEQVMRATVAMKKNWSPSDRQLGLRKWSSPNKELQPPERSQTGKHRRHEQNREVEKVLGLNERRTQNQEPVGKPETA